MKDDLRNLRVSNISNLLSSSDSALYIARDNMPYLFSSEDVGAEFDLSKRALAQGFPQYVVADGVLAA